MKTWNRNELTDEALIACVSFVRNAAKERTLPFWLVREAQSIESVLPPLREMPQ